MALDAAQVEVLQNSTPTDFSKFDNQLSERSDFDKGRFALDDRLYVRFYMRPRLNVEKSTEANRPIFEETEYVEIMAPGEKNSIVQRPAWSQDYQRFAKQYAAFKAGKTEQDEGTPLNALPFLNESIIEELKYFKIHTVEKLANLSESVMQNFMGAREYQQKAQKWLTSLTSGEALAQQNNDLKAELARQQAQINELMQRLGATDVPDTTLHVKKR